MTEIYWLIVMMILDEGDDLVSESHTYTYYTLQYWCWAILQYYYEFMICIKYINIL